jgi:DNA-binding CsgD family transcriptional regulator
VLSSLFPGSILVYRFDACQGALRAVGQQGVSPAMFELFGVVPVDAPTPMGEAARSGAPVVVPVADVGARFPLLASIASEARPESQSLACVPLTRAGGLVGSVAFTFNRPVSSWSWAPGSVRDAAFTLVALWMLVRFPPAPADAARAARRALGLSDRQRLVLELVGKGLTNAQVAQQVGFSESTVKQEVMALLGLFAVPSRLDLAAAAGAAVAADSGAGGLEAGPDV